jgi:cell division protease FtsH
MVTRYGMSEKLGPMTFGQKEELVFLGKEIGEQRDYSEAVAQEIDEEVRGIVGKAYDLSKDILIRHREQLDRIAQQLIEVETINADEFVALFEGNSDKPDTSENPPPVSGIEWPTVQPVPEQPKSTLDMPPAPAPA